MKIRNLLCFVIVSIAAFVLTCAYAEDINNNISVSDAWVQAMPPSQKTTAAYMVITNNSSKEAVLVSASSDISATAEIHQMSDMGGMMNMAMASNIRIPALGKVTLAPSGFHIMLIDLKNSINKGDFVPITLHFQDGTSLSLKAVVRGQ